MNRSRVLVLPVTVFVLLSLAVLLTWERFRESDRSAAEERVQLVADQSAERLLDCVQARLVVLGVVRDEIAAGVASDRHSFADRTEHLQRQFAGFQAINWMDPAGVIRWTSPERPNRGALGRDVREHPIAGPVLRQVNATGAPSMTPPLELFQSGRGFTTYWPVVGDDGRVRGYVNGVFRTDRLVDVALGSTLDRFAVRIEDEGALVFASATLDDETDGGLEAEASVDLMDRRWTLRIRPRANTPEAVGTGRHALFLGGGIGLSLALALALGSTLLRGAERQRELEERRVLERQLGEAQKMEAVGRLAGGIAHDFNNLITAILGGAELVLRRGGADERARPHLEQIISTCERAAELTGQLLALSRRQVEQRPEVDVAAEIASLEPLLERLAADGITLETEIEPTAGVAALTPGQLGQIVLNLVVNAGDAMPEGGPVRLSVNTENTGPDGAPGAWARITVRDRGHGMDKETTSRIFEPFFTTKRAGKGTGLGLSTVYGIVVSAGGQIRVASRPDVGTSFEVWLPLSEPRDPGGAESSRSDAADAREGLAGAVLLVEDRPDVREIAATILRDGGLEVVEATDGEHALALVDSGASFDWVLSDVVMPRMGGPALLRELRARGRRFGAVLVSGHPRDIESGTLEELQAIFLPKPFRPAALFDALRRSLEWSASRDPRGDSS